MKFTIDQDKESRKIILAPLRAYNRSQTGERKEDSCSLFIEKEKSLLAGIEIHVGWDWISIGHLKYDTIASLKDLLHKAMILYKDDVIGIRYCTEFVHVKDDLITAGFIQTGTVKYSPNMPEVFYLEYKIPENIETLSHEFIVIGKEDEPLEDYNNILKACTEDLNTQYGVKHSNESINILAYEGDEFAGGLNSDLYDDHMYISLLVVEEKFRGRQLGSTLMNKIEDYIKDKEIKTISLGTCEFQARPFYEKLGYKVVMTQVDNPKGFECYTLIKEV